MQKLSSFGRGKKFRPKKSLTSLLHAALQLFIFLLQLYPIIIKLLKKQIMGILYLVSRHGC